MSIPASDPITAALATALDGLALRQKVTANNIANVDTPHFTASRVDFESSLRAALDSGTLDTSSLGDPTIGTVLPTSGPPSATGNNVDLGTEEMTALQATFRYQLLSRAVGDRFGLVTTAIGGM
jgi:flagellar basal-body rod protein FlgB